MGWTRKEDRAEGSEKVQEKIILNSNFLGRAVVFMKCSSALGAKALFRHFRSALLNDWKIRESEVISFRKLAM